MTSKLLIAALLSSVFALPTLAQSTSSNQSSDSSSSSSQSNVALQQKIKADLQQTGFSNVQVMPQSFLVRAHDKQDRPVMMIINPDGVTAVTQMGMQSGSSGNQSGSKSTDTKKQ